MPQSAIASGCVDFVMPPQEIANEIVRISKHLYAVPDELARKADDKPNLSRVVQLLHHATGVDFTGYKFNTLYRRVTRRMLFQKMDSLDEYLQHLRQTPAEVESLYQDILISVTCFFRDNESFEAIKEIVFARLLKDGNRHDPVRIWILGCSTGQEAYSLAMAFTEAAEAAGSETPVQLFASDLNTVSIEKARAGVYPKEIVRDVSPERLRRFFTEVDGKYRISKTIRDACVFSRHNVLTDPPFSRIDLISCRNLLIYLEPVLQQKILPTLHFALKPKGYLWLGGSESIGNYRSLFKAEDVKHKIYAKKPGSSTGNKTFSLQPGGAFRAPFVAASDRTDGATELHREADRILLTKFSPPGVLISNNLEILQYRGDTSPFLAPAPGKASHSLPKMLREGLLIAVRAAIHRAANTESPVREEGLQVKSNGGYHEVAIEVIPLRGSESLGGGYLVLFDESSWQSKANKQSALEPLPPVSTSSSADVEIARVLQELAATREYLQSVIEQQEAANEELQSANEEVQSANEELQSTNEELETSKEEIQSSNEELATVNDELNNRNAELHRVNDDLVNLLGSVQMAIVILGSDLRVRRFTPSAEKVLNLIPTDVGRPLTDIQLNLDNLADLEVLLTEVLDTVSVKEREVRDKHGRWYSLRLRPYRTLDNRIDGVVLMLIDVDVMKHAEEAMARLAAIVTSSDDAIISTALDGTITSWNKGAERLFGYSAESAIGKPMSLLTPDDLNDEEPKILERIGRGEAIEIYETVRKRQDGSLVDVSLMASPVQDQAGRTIGAAKIARDITERIRAEEAEREGHARFEELFDASPVGMYLVDADLRIRLVSRNARPVFGDIGELIGRDFDEVIRILWPPAIADEFVARFRHTLETGDPYSVSDFSAERHDRKVVESYDWRIRRIGLPHGHFGVVCYFIDISERMQLSNKLRRYAADLADSDRRKDEFLAMLSHELRNPLAAILNAVELLGLQQNETEVQQRARAIIERQLGQLVRLVDELLEVSRISTGRIHLRCVQLDFREVVKCGVETVRPLIEKRRHALDVQLSDSQLWIMGDSSRLEQMVVNLLNNAAKFTDEGGRVWVNLQQDGNEALLKVRDAGVGIAPDLLPRIFDLFTQSARSLARSQGGLGIGLALVQRLVEMHGGKVTAFSTLGEGSEFVVRIPLLSSPLPQPDPPFSEKEGSASRSLRVLVVEDSLDEAESLEMLLRKLGHEVRMAFDGPTAMEAVFNYLPNVVLMDIGLPEIDGYAVAKWIRQQSMLDKTVLVATTGYGREQDRQQSRAAGFDHHLVKPVPIEAIQKLLAIIAETTTHC
jgi:two-component system CheB/CheR fusion protein